MRYSMYTGDDKRRRQALNLVAKLVDRTLGRRERKRQKRLRRRDSVGVKSAASSLSWQRKPTPTTMTSSLTSMTSSCLSGCCSCCYCLRAGGCGCLLTAAFVLSKVLSIAVPIGNVLFMDVVFGTTYWRYGVDFLQALYGKATNFDLDFDLDDVEERRHPTGGIHFPRVTLCDLDVRSPGNVNRYTVQCVLTANLFIERIYLILWFWFVTLTVITFVGLIVFLFKLVGSERKRFVRNCLCSLPVATQQEAAFDENSPVDSYILQRLVNSYLKLDGFLLLYLINANANRMVTADVVLEIWTLYTSKPEVKKLREEREYALDEAMSRLADDSWDTGTMPAVPEEV